MTGRPLPIVIEVCTLDEVDDVLALGDGAVARILLDNMVAVGDDGDVDTSALCAAVARIAGRLPTEASGGVTAGTVGAIAQAGVDFVSCGALTHSVQAMDLSLEVRLDP